MLVSYAQNFEDVMLWRALRHVKNGFYIDIGAQDPVADSVSLAFYEHGWRGVHVEPVPTHVAALRAARPDETVIEAAVGESPGLVEMFEIPKTGLSTGVQQIAEIHATSGLATSRFQVPCIALSDLLQRHADRDIHWMKIDVEGMEESVLRSWSPSPARPWIVVVEATFPRTSVPAFADWDFLVLEMGYRMAYFDGLNRFYVSDRHPELMSSFSAPPNVFDGFALSGSGCHSFCDVVLQQSRNEKTLSEAVRSELMEVKVRLTAELALTEQLKDEVTRKSQRVGILETRVAETERHALDLTGEIRSASDALQAATMMHYEERDRARALEAELHAGQRALNLAVAESLRLQAIVSESEKARLASEQAAQWNTQRSSFEAERRLSVAQARSTELAGQLTLLRARHEEQVAYFLAEIARIDAGPPRIAHDEHSRYARVVSNPIINTLFRLDPNTAVAADLIMDAPMFTRTSFQPTFVVQESGTYDLDDFLVLHDRVFVRATYLAVLHRPADPEGEAFYLQQVRAGEYKSRIIDQIMQSEEAKTHTTVIHGLREHLRILRICRIPLFGRWIAAVLFLARVDEHLRELRGFENHVIRMAEEAQLIHEANVKKLRAII